jgi:hypothetical protein
MKEALEIGQQYVEDVDEDFDSNPPGYSSAPVNDDPNSMCVVWCCRCVHWRRRTVTCAVCVRGGGGGGGNF